MKRSWGCCRSCSGAPPYDSPLCSRRGSWRWPPLVVVAGRERVVQHQRPVVRHEVVGVDGGGVRYPARARTFAAVGKNQPSRVLVLHLLHLMVLVLMSRIV